MSISSTGLYGASATIVNTDLFDDVEKLKSDVNVFTTSYLGILADVSTNKVDISINLNKINDISNNRIVDIENDVLDLSNNRIKDIENDVLDISSNIIEIKSNLSSLTTNQIPEGNSTEVLNNLYYTDDRVDTRIQSKTTDNITEGTTNLYYKDGLIVNTLYNDINGYLDIENNIVLGIKQVINGYGDNPDSEEYIKGILDHIQDLKNKDDEQDKTAIASMIAQALYEAGKWAAGKAKNGGLFGSKLTN